MKKYIMAIDQGTTSTRAILFDHDSNMVGIAQKEIENYYPHPGWVEQNANDVWASTVGVMFEVLAKTGVKEEEIKGKPRLYGIKKVDSLFTSQSFGSLGKAIPIVKNLNRKEKKSGLRKNAVFYLIHIFPQVKFAGS